MNRYLFFYIIIFFCISCNAPDGKMERKLLEWTSDYVYFDFSKKKQKATINIPSEGGNFLFVCTNGGCLGFCNEKLLNFDNPLSFSTDDSLYCKDSFSAVFVDKNSKIGGTKFSITFENNLSNEQRILKFGVSPCTTGAYTDFEFIQQAKSN